ncbi:hypothetical protein DRQ53_05195 [bacterium]|nr:MAG: hypothetical protein DRQ53_05195 [bacterium]
MNGPATSIAAWQVMILMGIATQLLKFLLYGVVNRKINLRLLVTAHGFPSLHAVVLSCLSILAGLEYGFHSALFVVPFVFTGIILHDMMKVHGSVHSGQVTGLFLARAFDDGEPGSWSERWASLLLDRGHRPLHVGASMTIGILSALAWGAR